jgi:hypothetical protein
MNRERLVAEIMAKNEIMARRILNGDKEAIDFVLTKARKASPDLTEEQLLSWAKRVTGTFDQRMVIAEKAADVLINRKPRLNWLYILIIATIVFFLLEWLVGK